jgi:hypothetical protein
MKLQANSFGKVNFGNTKLGDTRRTRRLVQVANLMQRRPGGSLPQKIRSPKDLRAFYRLMNSDGVTHKVILQAHRKVVLANIEQMDSPVLVLHDATELDYTNHHSLEDLGQIGNGHHRGYIAQNSLAVDPNTREVVGLLGQVLHHRVRVPKKEGTAKKRERESRESRLWLTGTEPLPASWQLIDVCDQGADTFEFLEHEFNSGRRFVVRAAHNRGIWIGHDEAATCESGLLRDFARKLPEAGTWTLRVTSKVETKTSKKKGKTKGKKRKARNANMAVAFAPVQIKSPHQKRGNHGNEPLPMWVVRVWEVDPPEGEERLEWFLLTNESVESFEDAYRVVGWYECRWIVEEYHKGMKTGCKIESPQFTTEAGLKPTIALLSIVTLTLLKMRDASRRADAKTRKATEFISADYVTVLSGWRHGKERLGWSVYDFMYALARLGGHQNRKSDHPPGWQTIWEGWRELHAMVCGAEVMKSMERCGKT